MGAEQGSLFAEERKIQIVELVNSRKKATVQELCDHFKVSSATIRNDLRDLERQNQLIRTHGGALIKSQTGHEVRIDKRDVQRPQEKQRIAKAAIKLIEDGDSIVLDTGTTTYELALLLKQRRDLTVVTNDLKIALLLEQYDGINVLVLGGILRRHFHSTVGDAGKKMLFELSVDKAFMGANSISATEGGSTPDISTAETKRAMISIASQVVLLCDSDKVNRRSFAKFAEPQQIDALVTDAMEAELREQFGQNDIEVILA